jgi:hypothetical protein
MTFFIYFKSTTTTLWGRCSNNTNTPTTQALQLSAECQMEISGNDKQILNKFNT